MTLDDILTNGNLIADELPLLPDNWSDQTTLIINKDLALDDIMRCEFTNADGHLITREELSSEITDRELWSIYSYQNKCFAVGPDKDGFCQCEDPKTAEYGMSIIYGAWQRIY